MVSKLGSKRLISSLSQTAGPVSYLMPDPDLRFLMSEDPDLAPDPDQEAPYLTTF